jgi:hypothetical protein
VTDVDPADIRRRLFSVGERLGWQFRDRHRFWRHWTAPRPERRRGPLMNVVLTVFAIVMVIYVLVLALATFREAVVTRAMGSGDWMSVGTAWLLLVPLVVVFAALLRGVPHARHVLTLAHWERDRDAHNAAERARVDAIDEWGAVRTLPGTRRIDLYGGEHEGWTAFLTTFGTSMLAERTPIVVLDLSRTAVSAELCEVARQSGVDCHVELLPDQIGVSSLLDGLTPDDVKDVLVEAISDDRVLDDRILSAVYEAVRPNPTLPRVHDALTILLGGPSRLGDAETGRVRELFAEDQLRRLHDRIQRLEAYVAHLKLLPTGRPAATAAQLTCFSVTERGSQLTTELVVDLLGQWLIRSLKNVRQGQSPRTVVVAGADQLRAQHLEQVAALCDSLGFRLVLLFRHLRDAGSALLGGGRATVFMRLGNYEEAELAANFIGRGYRFELSRMTTEHGESDTAARTTSTTGEFLSPLTRRWGSSRTRAHSTSWSYAETRQRVHELFVEPTHLQALPPTAFVLVQHVADRQVLAVAADCNPDLLSLPRVSTQPLADPNQVATPQLPERAPDPARALEP